MKIVMVGIRGFPNVQGGVENHAEHLCTALTELGCEVEVVVRSNYQRPEVGPAWKSIQFTSIWAPRSKGLETILHTFLAVLYAGIRRPDVLHIQAIGPGIMVPLARLLGLRVVVTHHGPDYDRQKWGRFAKAVLILGERFSMRLAHQRIVISRVIEGIVRKKHARTSALIPNGVVLPTISTSTNITVKFALTPERYILLVSRIVPEKRHLDLIEAFSRAKLDGWKLAIVGAADHPDAYTQAVLDAAARVPGVVCTGYQSGTALSELYSQAGIFVLPSSHEGLPIALLEALSYGIPTVASDIPANLEVASPDINFFSLGNIDALAAVLQKMVRDGRPPAYAKRTRQFVQENYSWPAIAKATLAVYSDAMTTGARPASIQSAN